MRKEEEKFFKEFKKLLEKYNVSSVNYTKETPICFEVKNGEYSHLNFFWDNGKIQDFRVEKHETKTFNI